MTMLVGDDSFDEVIHTPVVIIKDVKKAINSLNGNAAVGFDGISPIVKGLCDVAAQVFLLGFQFKFENRSISKCVENSSGSYICPKKKAT